MQRREYVRIDYVTRLHYALLKDRLEKDKELKWYASLTANISAGGALLKVGHSVQLNDLMIVKFANYSTIRIPRFIVALCRRLEKMENELYAGVEFVTASRLGNFLSTAEIEKLPPHIMKFDTNVQNRLVRFVFDEQVKDRNKGLL
jgi:c-di-GMP-binding flagellar brake protein YcgR